MSHILIFKTESMKESRYYYAQIFKELIDAEMQEHKLRENGYNEEKVVYANIVEGRK